MLNPTTAEMHVRRTDEEGHLDIAVDNENVRVTYNVDRERKEISKGIMGAIAGAGIGGVVGNILRKNQSSGDAIAAALEGAASGGAYQAYQGWDESENERTAFAAVLAETIKEVEDKVR